MDVRNEPRVIFLQRADGECGRTWCEERVNADDVEYVRADFAEEASCTTPAELQTIARALNDAYSDLSWALHRYAPPSEKEMIRETVQKVQKAYALARELNRRFGHFLDERALLGPQ